MPKKAKKPAKGNKPKQGRQAPKQGNQGRRKLRKRVDPDSAPLAMSRKIVNRDATLRGSRGRVVVTHREFCGYAINPNSATGAWCIDSDCPLPLTPANASLFPWLSTIASRYEEYRFLSLRLVYVPMSSAVTDGSVSTYLDYDARDGAPVDAISFENMSGATTDAVWKPFTMHVDCARKTGLAANVVYRYTNAWPGDGDRHLYQAGVVWIAYDGVLNSRPGKFYVDYSIEFIKPEIPVSIASLNVATVSPTSMTSGTGVLTSRLNTALQSSTPEAGMMRSFASKIESFTDVSVNDSIRIFTQIAEPLILNYLGSSGGGGAGNLLQPLAVKWFSLDGTDRTSEAQVNGWTNASADGKTASGTIRLNPPSKGYLQLQRLVTNVATSIDWFTVIGALCAYTSLPG